MAESTSEPTQKVEQAPADNNTSGAHIKQIESQMVSLNFVLKNTQSEVIKLQKALVRYQNRQDELEKKLEQTEREIVLTRANQQADKTFRSRFAFYQVVTVIVTLLLAMIMHNMLTPKPIIQQAPPVNTVIESSAASAENGN